MSNPQFSPCQVNARFTADGTPLPKSLEWNGEAYPIITIGRQWQSDDGFHILVKIQIGTFELRYQDGRWLGKRIDFGNHFSQI